MLLSVVICTYNRRDHLLAALHSVLRQTFSSTLYEIIVVDNCSTDGTADLVQSLAREHQNIHYHFENRLGLATARNTGWQASQGEYVAFLDDDAKAEQNWLETAAALFDREDADIHCVGGPIHPFYTTAQPQWWKDQYEIRSRGDAERHLNKGEFFSGSNMIWRKKTLEKYGGFEVNAGMKGNQLGMGEETGLFRKIWETEATPVFLYTPELLVYHWVPEDKMTMGYIIKRAVAAGQFEGEYALTPIGSDFMKRIKLVGDTTLTLIKQFLSVALLRWHYKTTQNWFFENCFYPFQSVGKLMRLLGLKVVVTQRK